MSQRGTSSSEANFVQPARAADAPLPTAEDESQKPQIRIADMIASFEFEFIV